MAIATYTLNFILAEAELSIVLWSLKNLTFRSRTESIVDTIALCPYDCPFCMLCAQEPYLIAKLDSAEKAWKEMSVWLLFSIHLWFFF